MVPLGNPHWETVPSDTREIISVLGEIPEVRPFYLAGGTALALRLGHRISRDLDLFVDTEDFRDAWRHSIEQQLNQAFTVKTNQDSPLGLVLEVQGVDVGLFTYGYPILDPTNTALGLRIAGVTDVGLMKLDAIAGRGFRRDFYDVYFVSQHIPLDALFEASRKKFPYVRGFPMRVLRSLVDFDIADMQSDPIMINQVSWETVKQFFVNESRALGRKWFGEK